MNREALDSLRSECNKIGYAPQLLEVALTLKNKAEELKDNYNIGSAYYYIFRYYQIHYHKGNKMDTIRFYGEKAIEYFKKSNHQESILEVEADLLKWEMFEGSPERIVKKTFQFIKEAQDLNDGKAILDGYDILGKFYSLSNSPQDALNTFEKELEYLRSMNNGDSLWVFTHYLRAFGSLMNAALQVKDFDLTRDYSDSVRLYIEKYPEYHIYSNISSISADIITTASYLSEKDGIEKAKPYAKKLQAYSDSLDRNNLVENNIVYYSIQGVLAQYYKGNGEYNTALRLINKCIEHFSQTSYHQYIIPETKDIKAHILAELGQYKEAFQLKADVLAYIDSINQVNVSRQINEIYIMYNVDELEKKTVEEQAKAKQSQTVSIFLIVACILLISLVITIKSSLNKLKEKNEKLYAQYLDMDKYRKEIDLLNMNQDRNDNNIPAKESALFDKIENYIIEKQIYREPGLSRESFALELATNRQYLTQAIQDNTGKTFTEYINHYRLEYSRQLLVTNISLSIENVYTSAGFNNKSTFYRLFKQKYGLTPNEFREIALKEK
ncbi:MAG: helix-turn-helix domain-containing protein [Dysgonomonas sp.]|nr:helix-turn-helix domain-containing protein [Dysgonomonas sp.]